MFGLAASASPGIVSEPLARASREDVAMRFDAGSLKLWTARSSKQTALSSASSSFSDKASLCTCAIFTACRGQSALRWDDQLLRGPVQIQSDASKGVSVGRRGHAAFFVLGIECLVFWRRRPQLRFGGGTGEVRRRCNGARRTFDKRAGDLWAPSRTPLTRNMARRWESLRSSFDVPHLTHGLCEARD